MAAAAEPVTDTPLSAEEVFDSVGPAYETAFEGLPEQAASLQWLLAQLAARRPARVLDVGCGTGRPVCAALAEAGHHVLGIDISDAMIAAARDRVGRVYPTDDGDDNSNSNSSKGTARFAKADVRTFVPAPPFARRADDPQLDAVTVYFSLIAGLSQDEIRAVLARIHGFLRPGGLFVFATVPLPADRLRIRWMGRPVEVSSLAPADAVAAVRAAGFVVEREVHSSFTPRAADAGICAADEVWEEPHLFVYARKPEA